MQASSLPVALASSDSDNPPALMIAEVKVRNDATGYDEFIKIFNPGEEAVELANYYLEYFNLTYPPDGQLPTKKSVVHPTGLLEPNQFLVLAKELEQIPNSIASPFSSLADAGGKLRLVDGNGTSIDEVAWSSSLAINPVVYLTNNSSNNSISIHRQIGPDGHLLLASIWFLAPPSPVSSPLTVLAAQDSEPETSSGDCRGIIISELLPNPGGSDANKEYIELHNPTSDFISLDGCGLQTTAGSAIYRFSGQEIGSGEYLTYYDSLTGLNLPNAAGGTVYLLSINMEEWHTVTYPGNLEDDVAWSWFGQNQWELTYMPTPNAANIRMAEKPCPEGEERNPETDRCRGIATDAASLVACEPGQERNPDTNRCRTLATVDNLVPCREGQERNPETNRCRNLTTAANLIPCRAGQERNPETNRCRSTSSVAGLQACPEGSARNPETNRCRKVAGGLQETVVKDIATGPMNTSANWWLAGLGLVGALGYGVWEWRDNIRSLFKRKINDFA